jgi:hypothetical protein
VSFCAPQAILIATDAPKPTASGEVEVEPLFPVEAYIQQSIWFQTHYKHDSSHGLGPHYHIHVFVRVRQRATSHIVRTD